MHRFVSLGLASLVAAACVSVSPGQTVPPINVPTLPPINIPSIAIPSLPPINIPSLDIPLPSAVPGAGMCRLISAEEVGAALGSSVTVTESSDATCTYLSTSTFATITLRTEQTDLATAKMLLTNPTDLNVGGNPAVIGSFMGILLYIARGSETLVLQSVLLEDTEANRQKVIQMGTLAASRW